MTVNTETGAYDGNGGNSPQWWPSRYGADDLIGTANELTPDRTLSALKIPREGRVLELGQVLDRGAPVAPPRVWQQICLANFSLEATMFGHDGSQATGFDESVTQSFHSGTHIDAFGHAGIAGRHYNGIHYKDFYEMPGLSKLGIEQARPWVARGVCLDIAVLEDMDMLPAGFVITPQHLDAACERQNIEVHAGDVVLLHTGWSSLWNVDNDTYSALEPGLGWDGAHWITDRRVSLVGADNWALEVFPPESLDHPFIVHQHLLCETGTYILENINTAPLVEGDHSEFLFILSPIKTRGSTASMAAPLAVV